MSHLPPPPGQIRALVGAAEHAGALLVPVAPTVARDLLAPVLADAARRQTFVPGYVAELRMWSGRYAASRDGVPLTNVAHAPVGLIAPTPLRHFPHGALAQPPDSSGPRTPDDAAVLLVLATAGDDVPDHLAAGEATSAVLLTATRLGLATTPLSQVTEVHATRELLRRTVLHLPEHPQILLRIGRPAPYADELPETPRRPLDVVLLPG
jgi:hypothetical protein